MIGKYVGFLGTNQHYFNHYWHKDTFSLIVAEAVGQSLRLRLPIGKVRGACPTSNCASGGGDDISKGEQRVHGVLSYSSQNAK